MKAHPNSKFQGCNFLPLSLRIRGWMKKNESLISTSDFCDITNTSFALSEKMFEKKLARKILRSLPKRFDMKVTAIEEAQDLISIKVDKIIGSLQTFEISINERSEKKNKGIAFVSNDEESQGDIEENLSDDIYFLSKRFNNSLKYLNKK